MPLTDSQLAGLLGDDDTSVNTPAVTAADIERIKAELQADFDSRISGFQSKVVAPRDQRISALEAELEELKTAGLSEEEREQLLDQKKDREIEELRAKLELKELGGTYGEELPLYERLIAADSAEEQLKILREIRAAAAPATTNSDPADEVDEEPSDIDPNRPMRSAFGGAIRLADGQVMSEELADSILGAHARR